MKALLLLLISSIPCYARILETRDQCVARYGPSISEYKAGRADDVKFAKGAFDLEIIFLDGIAVQETYSKTGDSSTVLLNEAQSILEKETGAFKWSAPTAFDGYRWKRSDGVTAQLYLDVLTISSDKWDEAFDLILKQKAQKETTGL